MQWKKLRTRGDTVGRWAMNALYTGDNLTVMQRHMRDELVYLVHLDPPFKSDANYNVLFHEHDGSKPASQILAFEDTWHWGQSAARAFEETGSSKAGQIVDVMRAFRTFLGPNDMLADLSMMAPRLVEIRRIMKPSASIHPRVQPLTVEEIMNGRDIDRPTYTSNRALKSGDKSSRRYPKKNSPQRQLLLNADLRDGLFSDENRDNRPTGDST